MSITERSVNALHACLMALLIAIGSMLYANPALAQSESALSNYNLGVEAYRQGDFRQAFDAWSLGAYEGDPEAQYNLGVLYLEGRGVQRSAEQARSWFLQAAEKNHLEAQYNLGHMALSGMGVKKDANEAMLWWRQAAEGGYPQAQFNYGRALYLGVGDMQNVTQGLAFIQKAAQQKDKRATEFLEQNQLAVADKPEEKTSDQALEALISTAENEQLSAMKRNKNKPVVEVLQTEAVEVVELEPEIIEDYQPGKVKLNIVRDEPVIRRNYFMRTLDRAVPVFALPDLSGQLEVLAPATLVKVLAVEADNLKIEVVSDLLVWVRRADVQIDANAAQAPKSGRGMYAAPNGQKLGELPQTLSMRILEQDGAWLKLSLPQHIFGWIGARNLAYSGEGSQQLQALWMQRLASLDGYQPDLNLTLAQQSPPQNSTTEVASLIQPAAVVEVVKKQPENRSKSLVMDDNTWLFTQPDGSYVVHVFTLLDQQKAVKIANQTRYHAKAHLYTTTAKNQHWTFMLLGPYADVKQAKAARESLPRGLRKGARVRLLSLIAENRCKKRAILSAQIAKGLDAYCL